MNKMKNYVLDSSVLIYDAFSLFRFAENNVIIPLSAIEEINRFSNDVNERGRNARFVARYLDGLRKKGSLGSGVKLKNEGTLYIKTADSEISRSITFLNEKPSRHDAAISVAIQTKNNTEFKTILVTKDVCMRLKADAVGLNVEDYESDKVDIEELYSGYISLNADIGKIDKLKKRNSVEIEGDFLPNQYVILENGKTNAKGRFDSWKKAVIPLAVPEDGRDWRVAARNREQELALDALINDSVELVTLLGKAGTGKTLLAVAAGIFKTVDENVFSRVLVSRPTLPMGKDIGYLPGTVEEKLSPWMYPISDNIELIMKNEKRKRGKTLGFRDLLDMGIVVVEPLTYIRGRSIHNQYLIIDEAQNLTPHEIKTIITRAGDGSKIVLTGDPYQIDNPYIDASSNGLAYVVERMKKENISAHVTLKKGERSRISELAANLL